MIDGLGFRPLPDVPEQVLVKNDLVLGQEPHSIRVVWAMCHAKRTPEAFVRYDLHFARMRIFYPRVKMTEFLALPAFLGANTPGRIDLGHVVGFLVDGCVEVKRHIHRNANVPQTITDSDGNGPVYELGTGPEHRVDVAQLIQLAEQLFRSGQANEGVEGDVVPLAGRVREDKG